MALYRFAEREEVPIILSFIRQLAEYEKMSDQVVATEELLEEHLFDRGHAEVLLVKEDGVAVGFALFYTTFSTFLGRPGIHLEDLYVNPEHRGKGYGKGLLTHLARIAVERGYGRLEWDCLDWNEPSIEFYRSMGAQQLDEWLTFRLAGDALEELAEKLE